MPVTDMRNHRIFAPVLATTLVLSACSAVSSPSPEQSVPANASIPADTASPGPLPGGRLVYGRFLDGGVTVFTSNPDGSDEQVLRQPDVDGGASWAPDGTKLGIVALSPEGLIVTAQVNPDGSGYVRFDSPDATLNIGCPAWSPDASRLACGAWDDTDPTRNGIYTVSASDGGDLIRVTTSPDGFHDDPGDYSPDGRQIVFTRHDPDSNLENTTLMVVNVDGSDEHALTDRKVGNASSWSPDGTTILTDAVGSLLLVPVEGGAAAPITIEGVTGAEASRAAWSPDGEWIVFSMAVGPLGQASRAPNIYIMRKDGTDLRQITNTPGHDNELADWGVAPALDR